jgi:Nucleotide modification associated domain 2
VPLTSMAKVYMYVVARDFGFAPNPFHGVCTLATCKPIIRRTAQIGDWVIGMGGSKLKAPGRCIYAMQVTGALSFDEYWAAPEYQAKKPVRNGSRKTIVGDNIYRHTAGSGELANQTGRQIDTICSMTRGLTAF